jgi:hypothetical protein
MLRYLIFPGLLCLYACMPMQHSVSYTNDYPPLYLWNKYEKNCRSYLLKSDEKNADDLIDVYQSLQTHQSPAPGIHADHGILMLKKNNPAAAMTFFEKEMNLYPESQIYVKRIMAKMDDMNRADAQNE